MLSVAFAPMSSSPPPPPQVQYHNHATPQYIVLIHDRTCRGYTRRMPCIPVRSGCNACYFGKRVDLSCVPWTSRNWHHSQTGAGAAAVSTRPLPSWLRHSIGSLREASRQSVLPFDLPAGSSTPISAYRTMCPTNMSSTSTPSQFSATSNVSPSAVGGPTSIAIYLGGVFKCQAQQSLSLVRLHTSTRCGVLARAGSYYYIPRRTV